MKPQPRSVSDFEAHRQRIAELREELLREAAEDRELPDPTEDDNDDGDDAA